MAQRKRRSFSDPTKEVHPTQWLRMDRIALSFQILFSICYAPAVAGGQEVISEGLDPAEMTAMVENGDVAEVIRRLESARDSAQIPSAETLLWLATAYNLNGQHLSAVEAATEGLGLDPDPEILGELHFALGTGIMVQELTEAQEGHREVAKEKILAAERSFEKAVSLSGDTSNDARLQLALTQFTLGRHSSSTTEEAQGYFRQTVRLLRKFLLEDPAHPKARQARLMLCGTLDCSPAKYSESTSARENTPDSLAEPVGAAEASPERPTKRMPGDITPPKKLSTIPPHYTEIARKYRVRGAVVLETIINQQGEMTTVNVLEGLPCGLSESAVLAVKQWRFKPATVDGEPVDVRYVLTVDFALK